MPSILIAVQLGFSWHDVMHAPVTILEQSQCGTAEKLALCVVDSYYTVTGRDGWPES